MEFHTTSLATRCAVKVCVPGSERQRFIAAFGGLFMTKTPFEAHVIQWYFLEF